MGMLIYFGTAAGVYVSLLALSYLSPSRRQNAQLVTAAGEAPEAPPPQRQKKPTVVDFRDSSSVMRFMQTLLTLGLICGYCYVCEKMPLYPAGKRLEGGDYYWFFVFLFFVAGLLTMENSGTAKMLHREQTNEWKGWMQYVFILYHYMHAEYVYKPVRVFVSTYVWMTGFGNFLFFDAVSVTASLHCVSLALLSVLTAFGGFFNRFKYLLVWILSGSSYFAVRILASACVFCRLLTALRRTVIKLVILVLFSPNTFFSVFLRYDLVYGAMPDFSRGRCVDRCRWVTLAPSASCRSCGV